ncbi:frataxin, mitochondrial [Selaginella moellendorffii]|nr:frataxin, mitochondrial [Selaginella moellendorffii]XP_024516986.1 frataxin, mitochondrial [Selaginella moellendorffii]|eukprot:XP_002987370.2 frataxin, mitochondrial [Selaginella moellendorffii]
MVKLAARVISSLFSRATSGRWRLSASVGRYYLMGRTSRGWNSTGSSRLAEARGFHSAGAWYGAQEGSNGTATVDYSSQLPEKEFHSVANETLHRLQEKIDEYGEKLAIDGFDTDFAEGVLTVRLGDLGTYVINKQTPNRQIWLSSPVSGPARFDWQDSQWVYRRTKVELQSLLEKELSELLGHSIDLGE